jgi:hypothetical protein
VQHYLDYPEQTSWETVRELAEEQLEFQLALEREVLEERGLTGEPKEDASKVGLGRSKPERFEPIFTTKLPERERLRADMLLKIGMRKAAQGPDVKRFRHERLGSERVHFDEAEAFISPGLSEDITDQELADLARRLERDYGWRRNEAAWFVLNGAAPRLRPLTTRVSMRQGKYAPSSCEITLQVAPWIPPEEVEKAFVQARDAVRGGPGTVGKRRLEVLRFVEEEYAKRERQPTFEELLPAWNQEHPHWPYTDYRALSKAYREARKEVVYPEYHLPSKPS